MFIIFLRTILHLTSSNNLPANSNHKAEESYTRPDWHILRKVSEMRSFMFYAFQACPRVNEALVILYNIYLSKITFLKLRNLLNIAYSWHVDYKKSTLSQIIGTPCVCDKSDLKNSINLTNHALASLSSK